MTDANRPPTVVPELADVDLSGQQIGGYRLLRRLGSGAMAEVFLAEQTSLKRPVAFKVLRRNLSADDSYVKRFHFEAQAAATLVHANIVQIYEVGCCEGVHFIAQEYVPGSNLQELIAKRGLPELSRAVQIMRQTALALAKAADAGIVHRDIKPENILIDDVGNVKVADFGLARLSRDTAATQLTQVGITMGTPLYMSPEQVEGKPLDARSDLYSLGCTFFQLLSGETPFRGDSALGLAVQHLNATPPALESLRPDLPRELCRIVRQMLAKRPEARQQSARELVAELQQFAASFANAENGAELASFDGNSSVGGISQIHGSQAAARLAAALRGEQVARAERRKWAVRALAICGVMFAIGLAAAYLSHEQPLLDASRDESADRPIDRLKSADLQLRYATQMLHPADTERREAALLAVEKYFPTHANEITQSKRHLALLYLQEDDYVKAGELFSELTRTGKNNAELRAFGLAGQALIASARQDNKAFAAAMRQLLPLRGRLDAEMKKLLDLVVARRQSQLENDLLKKWSEPASER